MFDYSKSIKDTVGVLETDIIGYKTKNDNYTGMLISMFDPVIALPTKISSLIDFINNNETGLLVQMNCRFIGVNFRRILSSMCGEVVFSLLGLGKVASVAGCLMFVAGFFACILGIRVKNAFPSSKDIADGELNHLYNNQ